MKDFFSSMRRFFEPAWMSWKGLLRLIFTSVSVILFFTGMIYCIQYAVAALESSDMHRFSLWIGIAVCLTVFLLVIKIFFKPIMFSFWRDMRDNIDRLYMPKIIQGDNNIYESYGIGRIVAIYSRGVVIWGDQIADIFSDVIKSVVLFVVFTATVASKDTLLLFLIFVVVLLVFGWFYFFGSAPYKRRKICKSIMVERGRLEVKRFMSKYEILQQNKLSEELQKKRSLTAEWYRFKKKEKMLQGIAFDGAGFLVGLLFIGLVAYVGFQLMEGRYQYADFVAITGLGIVFIKDLDDLLMQIRRMIDRHIDIKKIWELVDDLDTGFDVQQGLPFVFKQGNIVFDQVSYAYPGKLPVFSGFSLSIAGNKKTALVGPSGGGKSTLLKLLAGYLRSSDGTVAVDGQHINEVSLLSYYAHIGYLTQEPNVFDGTIRENLLYGVKEGQYREDDIASYVDKVLSMAKCEWVYDLPQGLDTEIGERGVRLSGGQRQRLAIAKIFLKDPQIVLLDEPTSALDSFSEEAITEAMQNLFAGRTVIIVAHRLQTVKSADEIIFIDEGQVVERGTHGELIALGGRYAKMLELQSGF